MTLPQAVEKCLRERKYVVSLQIEPVQKIVIHSEFNPGEGIKPLATIEYDNTTSRMNIEYIHCTDKVLSFLRYPAALDFNFPLVGHLSVVDRRITEYAKKRVTEIGRNGGPQNFYEAFAEFQRASGRF